MKHEGSSHPRRYRAIPVGPPTTVTARGEPVAAASQRGALTRQKVLTAALDVIDAGGAQEFTMRRVADRLGVETMARSTATSPAGSNCWTAS